MDNCPHRYDLEGAIDVHRNRTRCRLVDSPDWPAFLIPVPSCRACPGDDRAGSIVAAIRAHASYLKARATAPAQAVDSATPAKPPFCGTCAEKRQETINAMRTLAGLPPRESHQ